MVATGAECRCGLLPALRLGNARADDLVRNNGIAANAVALHKDHIVGHMFLISYRPNWRWHGDAGDRSKSFVDEVEAAWSEYAEGMFGEIDVEGKRTFTEFIREGVGVHAFNGEIFVQPVWDTETTQLFRTRFKSRESETGGHAWTRYGEPFSAGRCGGRSIWPCRRVPYLWG